MTKRVLVTYATRLGTTVDVADDIALILSNAGFDVSVKLVDDVRSVMQYDAVIVGSAIRTGRWLPEAVTFVKKHREVLAHMPVAYFLVCMTLKEDTPENRRIVSEYLAPVLSDVPEVKPVSIGLFSGVFDRQHAPFIMRLLANMVRLPGGDYHNYEQIGHWAHDLIPLLDLHRVTA